MRVTLWLALKYLWGQKSAHVIRIMSLLSVLGIAMGTMSLLLVLAVFNGFEDLLAQMVSRFNPDVKVLPARGKFLDRPFALADTLRMSEVVSDASVVMEEVALFRYRDRLQFGMIKGVDTHYLHVNAMDSALVDGRFVLRGSRGSYAVVGAGIASRLGVDVDNTLVPLGVHMPSRKRNIMGTHALKTRYLFPAGVFSIQHDVDAQYVLTNYEFVSKLLERPGRASAIEVKVSAPYTPEEGASALRRLLSSHEVEVLDRRRQDEAFYKIMNIEKWLFYVLFVLILILVTFNIVGVLWMMVLSKRRDIAILRAMGFKRTDIRNVFITKGVLISVLGWIVGVTLGLIFYWLHKRYGLIQIPEGFVVDSYPMSFRWGDLGVVGITVLALGTLASILPAMRAMDLPTTAYKDR